MTQILPICTSKDGNGIFGKGNLKLNLWLESLINGQPYSQINTTEKTLLEKIDSNTLLLKSCIISSYFESTISDCSVASILYTLWYDYCLFDECSTPLTVLAYLFQWNKLYFKVAFHHSLWINSVLISFILLHCTISRCLRWLQEFPHALFTLMT